MFLPDMPTSAKDRLLLRLKQVSARPYSLTSPTGKDLVPPLRGTHFYTLNSYESCFFCSQAYPCIPSAFPVLRCSSNWSKVIWTTGLTVFGTLRCPECHRRMQRTFNLRIP